MVTLIIKWIHTHKKASVDMQVYIYTVHTKKLYEEFSCIFWVAEYVETNFLSSQLTTNWILAHCTLDLSSHLPTRYTVLTCHMLED